MRHGTMNIKFKNGINVAMLSGIGLLRNTIFSKRKTAGQFTTSCLNILTRLADQILTTIMALNIPQLILQFIENQTETGSILLPYHYPKKDEWEEFQCGFRYHGLSGKDLTSTQEGEWQPGWHIIARNGMDDPSFIDLNEETSGFPVYYAPHGAGRWDAIALGFNIVSLVWRGQPSRDNLCLITCNS